ncbi:hypothetical protein [Luteipulveratus halotolerans]|uniref:hypothetical protein n=1 Tax=Luteipulveratus halotolerans TaxID=1631356 RepID=UPI0006814DC8|nr:hypothetical protein [Luteipulveratus halotolerans]
MTDEQLIATTPNAEWLPTGSSAEVWAGAHCQVPDDCIIVRLLLIRGDRFFCVPTVKGLDLPTQPLGRDGERMTPGDGLTKLLRTTVGRDGATTHCVGYVRNVVPEPDAGYPHPVPYAHVPVFTVEGAAAPVVDGEWLTLDGARPDLDVRHWWPIVEAAFDRAG